MYRSFTDSDKIILVEMINGLYREDPYGVPINLEKIEKTICFSKKHPDVLQLWMITHDDQVAGYALVNSSWSNEYGGIVKNIDELYIMEKFRGKGLSKDFIKWLQIEGCVTVALECAPENGSALEYYLKNGFVVSHNIHLVKTVLSE